MKYCNLTVPLRIVIQSSITVDDVHLTVKDGKEITLQRIVDYDAKVAKYRREDFVRQWAVDRIDAICKVYYVKLLQLKL